MTALPARRGESTPSSQNESTVAPELATWIELQKEEIAVRRYEAETKRHQDERAYAFATQVLNAQLTDRTEQRVVEKTHGRYGMWIVLGCLVMCGILGGLLIWTGHSEIIAEIVST